MQTEANLSLREKKEKTISTNTEKYYIGVSLIFGNFTETYMFAYFKATC